MRTMGKAEIHDSHGSLFHLIPIDLPAERVEVPGNIKRSLSSAEGTLP